MSIMGRSEQGKATLLPTVNKESIVELQPQPFSYFETGSHSVAQVSIKLTL